MNRSAPSEHPRLNFEQQVAVDSRRDVAIISGITLSNGSAQDEEWYVHLDDVFRRLRTTHVQFTADDVWDTLEKIGLRGPFAHSSGLGQVMRQMSQNSQIVKVGLRASHRLTERCHAKLHVLWQWNEGSRSPVPDVPESRSISGSNR